MVGRQGKYSVGRGRENRNRILKELLKGSAHFSKLKVTLSMSNVTLSKHLKKLLDEGRLKRQVEGRKIVYVVVDRKQTVKDMRKECWNELLLFIDRYSIGLTKETKRKLHEAAEVLKESILHPEEDLDKTYVGRLEMKRKRGSGK